MKLAPQLVAGVCKRYGAFLQGLPAGISGAALLWALAGNESSFGADVVIRHEPEYCPQLAWHKHLTPGAAEQYLLRAGRYAADPRQPELHRDFGCLACSSFTPWQIMAVHALGYTPMELLLDLDKGAEAVVAFLNRKIVTLQPRDLEDFAHFWNGAGTSPQYVADLQKHYAAGVPA